jgi:hypothetical protein
VLDLLLEAFENNISQVHNTPIKGKTDKICTNLASFEKITVKFMELISGEKSKAISSLLGFKL